MVGLFHKYHNTISFPSKILHKHCSISPQEKLKTILMQKFEGNRNSTMMVFLLARTSLEPLIGSCWLEALLFRIGVIVSFVWLRAIYCFLNQCCEPFLEFPAHRYF